MLTMEAKITTSKQSFHSRQHEVCRMAQVLIVDDDPIVRHFLHRMLTIQGYECWAFEPGSDALQYLRDHRPSLMIVDYHMSRMSGVQFLERVAGEVGGETIPSILLTKLNDQHDVLNDKAKALHVRSVLTKPLDYRKISVAVAAVMS